MKSFKQIYRYAPKFTRITRKIGAIQKLRNAWEGGGMVSLATNCYEGVAGGGESFLLCNRGFFEMYLFFTTARKSGNIILIY